MSGLRPFWRYYGGKFRLAPLYPRPEHSTIIEPFAGAAGYALRYPDREVILIEKSPTIAAIWRYLTTTTAYDVRSIPLVDDVDDLPLSIEPGARALVGFSMNAATTMPRKKLSSGCRRLRERGRKFYGWTEAMRERVASQVDAIRHWIIICGDYTKAPDVTATWFVDSPYNGAAGAHYPHGSGAIDYAQLAAWTLARSGQVIACEAQGASWLPFAPLANAKAGPRSRISAEAVWHRSAEQWQDEIDRHDEIEVHERERDEQIADEVDSNL